MPSRVIALLVLLAVLPTVELSEQVAHVVEHVVDGDAFDHDAHHEAPADEHGCTTLVHLCSCHQALVTAALQPTPLTAVDVWRGVATGVPPDLIDSAPLEPPHRPPIG